MELTFVGLLDYLSFTVPVVPCVIHLHHYTSVDLSGFKGYFVKRSPAITGQWSEIYRSSSFSARQPCRRVSRPPQDENIVQPHVFSQAAVIVVRPFGSVTNRCDGTRMGQVFGVGRIEAGSGSVRNRVRR